MVERDDDVSIIACVDATGVACVRGDPRLPWRCREELTHFARTTSGGVLVMGRLTWEGLPEKVRFDTGRRRVVLSADPDFSGGDAVAGDPATALALCRDLWGDRSVWVIGGPRTWEAFLEAGLVSRVLVSRLRSTRAAGARESLVRWSPPAEWRRTPVQEHGDFVVEDWRAAP